MRLLLVHGLARTPLSLGRLARVLRRDGHVVERAGYVAAVEHYTTIRDRIHRRLLALGQQSDPYAVIGHSLGGLLLRAALALTPRPARLPVRFVMLGTPNRVPRLAQRLHRWWPYRLVNGECGQLLARPEFFTTIPTPSLPPTIIVGTRGPRGRWSPFGQDDNDGMVAVAEAQVAGATVICLPVRHTFMMNDRGVQKAIRELLVPGR